MHNPNNIATLGARSQPEIVQWVSFRLCLFRTGVLCCALCMLFADFGLGWRPSAIMHRSLRIALSFSPPTRDKIPPAGL
jgi:hypothetical protein